MIDINSFLDESITLTLKSATQFYLHNKSGRQFLNRLAPAMREASRRRKGHEDGGLHVPAFLISSIATQCNLNCAGCYARAGASCGDTAGADMTANQWRKIFQEASDLGVAFIILAGGEPLMRRDVLEEAAKFPNLIFPIFTNGTLLNESYLALFEQHRHLIPVVSIEGDAQRTDERRGTGVAQRTYTAMEAFQQKGLLYGVSITVTAQNFDAVTEQAFVQGIHDRGCGVLFYIEYVPAEADTDHLVLSQEQCGELGVRTEAMKAKYPGQIVVSFPGDEEMMGGCLAAGRGFFHINAVGGAEPCPFSPYSQMNLQEHSIVDALKSPFFTQMRDIACAAGAHHGGCTLFSQKDEVERVVAGH